MPRFFEISRLLSITFCLVLRFRRPGASIDKTHRCCEFCRGSMVKLYKELPIFGPGVLCILIQDPVFRHEVIFDTPEVHPFTDIETDPDHVGNHSRDSAEKTNGIKQVL
jgi:hypothetical protein